MAGAFYTPDEGVTILTSNKTDLTDFQFLVHPVRSLEVIMPSLFEKAKKLSELKINNSS